MEVRATKQAERTMLAQAKHDMYRALPKGPIDAAKMAVGRRKLEPEWGNDELDMVKRSVINNQTRSRINFAVSDIHFTIGPDAQQEFGEKQTEDNRLKNPYFLMIDVDMSGAAKQFVYMWRKFEQQSTDKNGPDLLTDLTIARRPKGGQIKQQSRIHQLLMQGIACVPDTPDRVLPVELNLKRLRTHVAKPIKDIQVSMGPNDESRLLKRGFKKIECPWKSEEEKERGLGRWKADKLAKSAAFARGCFLWEIRENPKKPYSMKKAEGLISGEEYNAEFAQHYNEELQYVMNLLYLLEEDVELLWRLFKKMDLEDSDTIYVDDLIDFLDQGTTAWARALVRFVDGDPEQPIKFSQFVHLVGVFCMFEQREMLHFCFHLVEKDEDGFIDMEAFQKVVRMLAEDSNVVRPAQLTKAFKKFEKEGGKMRIDAFKKMIVHFPSITYPCFQLQSHMQQVALGVEYWKRKKEAMALGRKLVDKSEEAENAKRLADNAIRKAKKEDPLTKNLNDGEKKQLERLLTEAGKAQKSRLSTRFTRVFKELSKEQQLDLLKTLRGISDPNKRKQMMEITVQQGAEIQKKKNTGASTREKQAAGADKK